MKRLHPKWEDFFVGDGGRHCVADVPGATLFVDSFDEEWVWQVRATAGLQWGKSFSERGAKSAATRTYNKLVEDGTIKVLSDSEKMEVLCTQRMIEACKEEPRG